MYPWSEVGKREVGREDGGGGNWYSTYYFLWFSSAETEAYTLKLHHPLIGTCTLLISLASLDMPLCQIMFNIDKAHMIIDEMIANGHISETNKNRILAPVAVLDKAGK